MGNLINDLIDASENQYASVVAEGLSYNDVTTYIDTGSYSFNALLSGDIYKGIPGNKVIALAGEEATGKTFFAISSCKTFLDNNPDGIVFYFDTENSVTSDMFVKRGLDKNRVAVLGVDTVESFRTQMLKILDKYMALKKSEKKPLFIVLDSLGMLSTHKEVDDATEGKNTRDMTRTQLIKGAFRVLSLKLSIANVPLLITNHTYDTMGLFSKKEMSGGSGLKYAASTIIFLGKKQIKEGNEKVGNIIVCKAVKSRLTKEGKSVEVEIDFATGLDRYFGLLPFAESLGLFVACKGERREKYEIGGEVVSRSEIDKNPEKYFTKDVLDKINVVIRQEFLYGSDSSETDGVVVDEAVSDIVVEPKRRGRPRKEK